MFFLLAQFFFFVKKEKVFMQEAMKDPKKKGKMTKITNSKLSLLQR